MLFKGRLPQSPICVDSFTKKQAVSLHQSSFNSSVSMLYFLSHMHSDHTEGLNEAWNTSKIYCSEMTAVLVRTKYGLSPEIVVGLPENRSIDLPLSSLYQHSSSNTLYQSSNSPQSTDDVEKKSSNSDVPVGFVRVRLIPVSHCPGACAFIFDGYWGRYVYTGDLRYDKTTQTVFRQALQSQPAPIDLVLVDNTFASLRFAAFPNFIQTVDAIVSIIRQNPGRDVLLNSDMIGKEEILLGIAVRMQCLICVDTDKYTCLKALHEAGLSFHHILDVLSEDESDNLLESGVDYREYMSHPHWLDCFTTSEKDTYIHVRPKRFVSRGAVDSINSKRSANARRVIGIYMSGFSVDSPMSHTCTNFYQVTYSSHSSYSEICSLMTDLRPRQALAISSDTLDWAQFQSSLDPTPSRDVVIPDELRRQAGGIKRPLTQRTPPTEPAIEPKRRAFNIPMFIDDSDEENVDPAHQSVSRRAPQNEKPQHIMLIDSQSEIDLCDPSQDNELPVHPTPITSISRTEECIDPNSISRFVALDKRAWSLKIDPSRVHFMSRISMTEYVDFGIGDRDEDMRSPTSPVQVVPTASSMSVISSSFGNNVHSSLQSSSAAAAPLTEERLRHLERICVQQPQPRVASPSRFHRKRPSVIRGRLPLMMHEVGTTKPTKLRVLPPVIFQH